MLEDHRGSHSEDEGFVQNSHYSGCEIWNLLCVIPWGFICLSTIVYRAWLHLCGDHAFMGWRLKMVADEGGSVTFGACGMTSNGGDVSSGRMGAVAVGNGCSIGAVGIVGGTAGLYGVQKIASTIRHVDAREHDYCNQEEEEEEACNRSHGGFRSWECSR